MTKTAEEASRDRMQALAGVTAHKTVNFRNETDGDVTKMYIYDVIDAWFGIGATDVVEQLQSITTPTIELHLNSPGGSAFDGLAIKNALQQHDAHVVVIVDGLAASAASVIALAGDEIVMAPGAQMMVHDASAFCYGQASDMAKTSEILNKISDNIAAQYARRGGGTTDEWRAVMLEETWFNDEEAVTAGLADRVLATDDSEESRPADAAQNRWDLSVFAYAGREHAPAPHIPAAALAAHQPPAASAPGFTAPAASASGDTHQEGTDVAFTDAQYTALRQKLGVTDADADGDAVLAALDEALDERADDTAAATTTTPPDGFVMVDKTAFDAIKADAEAGRAARQQQVDDEQASHVDAAIRAGKFDALRRDHWLATMKADPDGTKALIDRLEPGSVVNLTERGHAASVTTADGSADDDVYNQLFPSEAATAAKEA